MYCNKIYSISTERIITRTQSNNTFDIELQHPQPRRRQIIDTNHVNDQDRDQYEVRMYSIPPGEETDLGPLESDPLSLMKNNLLAIPTNISAVESVPVVVSSIPEIIEEK